jgi:hypothetical protein
MPKAYSSSTTRRDFVRLTGAAFATAAAGTAVAAPIDTDADAEPDADVELLEVGEQLIALYERETELLKILDPYREEYDERLEAIVMSKADRARKRELETELRQEMGPEFIAADEEHARIVEAMDEPERRMFTLPAHTIDGLVLKAALAAYQNSELWSVPFNDLDREDNFFRSLIEAVFVFAGHPLPFAKLSALCTERSES